jgi:hypothetical protein
VVSDSLRAGRLGVERVGLIDDGGVMELWEEVSTATQRPGPVVPSSQRNSVIVRTHTHSRDN